MLSPSFSKAPPEIMNLDDDQIQEIINILQMTPYRRNTIGIQRLYEMFKEIKYFRELFSRISLEAAMTLLKHIKHEHVKKSETVFKYGDPATRFYFILKGSVYVIAPKRKRKKNLLPPKVVELAQSRRQSRIHRGSVLEMNGYVPEEEYATPEEVLKVYPNCLLLNTLKQGDHFGDAALNFNISRTATIVCRESSHFLTFSPSIYHKILNEDQKKKQKEVSEFFQTAPLTKDWPSENIVDLIYQSKLEEYKRNQVIFEIGDPCDFVYFIKKGEVELIKETVLNIPDDELSTKTLQSRHPLNIDKAKLVHMNSIWRQQYSQAKVRQIRIALLTEYQSFGNEEFGNSSETRQYKAVVKSASVELFVISYKKFVENKNNPKELCNKLMNTDGSLKNEWRETFEHHLINARLTNDDSLEKTRSLYKQELVEGLSMLNKQEHFAKNLHPERDRSPKSLSPLKPSMGFSKSVSPKKERLKTDTKMETAVPASPLLPLNGLKQKKFVKLISPDAKQVKVVFKAKNTIAIDPGLVPVCLQLASHSFQGSKMFQTCQNFSPRADAAEEYFAPPPYLYSPKNNFLSSNHMNIMDESSENSLNFTRNGFGSVSLGTHSIKKSKPGEEKVTQNMAETKLSNMIRLPKPRISKIPIDRKMLSLSISSMFVNDYPNSKHSDDSTYRSSTKDVLSPLSRTPVNRKALPPQSNDVYYVSKSYFPHTLPQKKITNFSCAQ